MTSGAWNCAYWKGSNEAAKCGGISEDVPGTKMIRSRTRLSRICDGPDWCGLLALWRARMLEAIFLCECVRNALALGGLKCGA